MSESVFYCPVSARFHQDGLPLWSPSDTPPRRLASDAAELVGIAAEVGERVSSVITEASDALFAAFSSGGDTVLVSRIAFELEALELITDELLAAAAESSLTGLRRAHVTPSGHVVAVLDYAPVAAELGDTDAVRAVFGVLSALHRAGLVHGGINERFLNPGLAEGRRLFGVGFSHAYAAFRRAEGLQVGDLRADPRFASAEELRGADASPESDSFALAAVCVTQALPPGEATPVMDPVQGINALLARAGHVARYRELSAAIGDRGVRTLVQQALAPERELDPRIWRLALAGALALLLLMQLWLLTRPAVKVEAGTSAESAETTRCSGPGVVQVGDECRLASNVGRCGVQTRLDEATATCVAIGGGDEPLRDRDPLPPREDPERSERRDSEIEQGPYIHPVLACEGERRVLEYKFSFSNADITLTQGERSTLSRLTSQCAGAASVVYYTSMPGMETRASTIFEEFRSSSQCSGRCQEVLPVEPTAVLYVPYVGSIERAANHYMFFHCCQN